MVCVLILAHRLCTRNARVGDQLYYKPQIPISPFAYRYYSLSEPYLVYIIHIWGSRLIPMSLFCEWVGDLSTLFSGLPLLLRNYPQVMSRLSTDNWYLCANPIAWVRADLENKARIGYRNTGIHIYGYLAITTESRSSNSRGALLI